MSRVLRPAASTRSVHLPHVLDGEVLGGDGAQDVVLQGFVVGMTGTTAIDVLRAQKLLEGGCIFQDLGQPTASHGSVRRLARRVEG